MGGLQHFVLSAFRVNADTVGAELLDDVVQVGQGNVTFEDVYELHESHSRVVIGLYHGCGETVPRDELLNTLLPFPIGVHVVELLGEVLDCRRNHCSILF